MVHLVSSGEAGGTWAILVAAGSGARLGGDRPKAFVGLAGRPLLAESLERLDAVRLGRRDRRRGGARLGGADDPARRGARGVEGVAVVTGGATRAESVRNALAEVPADALVVLVHDAARPLVDDAVIERLLGRLGEGLRRRRSGSSVRDTVKRVEGGLVVETISARALVGVQTPQAFLADRLRAAYAGDLTGATDCASLVERPGGRIGVVEGDPRLVKVTTPDDLALVERLLESTERVAVRAVFFDVGETLVDEQRYWREMAAAAGIAPQVIWAALGVTIERGEEHWALWTQLGLDRPDAWDRIVYSTDDLYPDALPCLERLRADGIVVGLAGNQNARWRSGRARPPSRRHRHRSASLGVRKPDTAFFRALRRALRPAPGGRVRRRPRRQRRTSRRWRPGSSPSICAVAPGVGCRRHPRRDRALLSEESRRRWPRCAMSGFATDLRMFYA